MSVLSSLQTNRLSLLLYCFICIGMLSTCQLGRRLTHSRRHYATSATAIAAADLIGGTEIDTGRYLLLAYELFSDVPHRSDSWYENAVFIKIKSLEALPIGEAVAIPNSAIAVSAYLKSTWHFENMHPITGTITRLASTPIGHKLKLNLRYDDQKSVSKTLLTKTLLFHKDSDYFKKHHIDYQGKYLDLRLALKEPAKVKSLDLVTYAIQYEKRNGPESGPDTLYERLGELYNMEELSLNLSGLKMLPTSMGRLKQLKKLDLGYNHLTAFPSLLLELDSLQELNLEYNRLDSIPAAVAQFRHLRILNLDDNRLTHYPMSVNAISGLQELGLSNANLRVLPDQLQQLTELRLLRLNGFWNNPRRNQLQDVSALRNLKRLRSLSLQDNYLSALPRGIYQLPMLEELNLRYTGLDSTKVDVSRFPNLKKLTF